MKREEFQELAGLATSQALRILGNAVKRGILTKDSKRHYNTEQCLVLAKEISERRSIPRADWVVQGSGT